MNKKETAIAQSKQELLKEAFSEWLWKDPDRRERVCKAYNILFNSNRPREYDGSHISFDGMNPEITLRRHQVNAIAHILYGGNTLLAHVVGAGKTLSLIHISPRNILISFGDEPPKSLEERIQEGDKQQRTQKKKRKNEPER